jgi:hypothetical protein
MIPVLTKYKYAMNIKLGAIEATAVTKLFPSVEDLIIASRQFEKLEEAVDSANRLVSEFTQSLNVAASAEKYKMVSEINPRFTGKETISTDWSEGEVAKLWIYDKAMHEKKPAHILAVALAQLLEIKGEPITLN